jgi:two-component system sensor histidine kinase PilS (NtrC family)
MVATFAVRLFTRPHSPGASFDPQWVPTIGVDLVAFSTLQFLQAGGINYSPLFALPVLMGSVLGSGLLALGTAAGVTLLLLTDAWVQSLHLPEETAARFLQAALTGTGYFALALLVNQMALRLAREERKARQSQRVARVQAQVNQLVIETLADGVLVVDAKARVHAANPAAEALLGLPEAAHEARFALSNEASWDPLAVLAQQTFAQRNAQVADVAIQLGTGEARRMHVRTRLTGSPLNPQESLCVMFLEDLREMEARLRTEKLAAMGRMSAAVAHEIRNPLAAIAQANALMEEDLQEPALRQLSALVHKNTQRLTQIVDEILNVTQIHRGEGSLRPLPLDSAVAGACSDWALQTGASARLHLALAAPGAQVQFEPDHLRRVLVNLLDNAARYAGQSPDSIRVATTLRERDATLQVWSDGAALAPAVEQRLFEPFFSSESRSTGLGLYICRELCARHGASITYRRTAGSLAMREGNEFVVSFRPGAPTLAGTQPFDTIAA